MKNNNYEEIINNKILKEIDNEELLIGKEKLDSEEAKNILTQYIANITKTALKYIRDDIKDSNEYLLKTIIVVSSIHIKSIASSTWKIVSFILSRVLSIAVKNIPLDKLLVLEYLLNTFILLSPLLNSNT